MVDVDDAFFTELVREALADVPPHLASAIANVEVIVEDANRDEPEMLGLYEGVPLTERGDFYAGVLPDRIYVYRLPLLHMCQTVFELAEEVRITVLHEIAHHFGIDDSDLEEWGWG